MAQVHLLQLDTHRHMPDSYRGRWITNPFAKTRVTEAMAHTSEGSRHIEVIKGSGPAVLAAPHGARRIPFAAIRAGQWNIKHDLKTDVLARELCVASETSEYSFSAVIALLHRAYVDLNREFSGDADREAYWHAYHRQVDSVLDEAAARHGAALLIDIHGCVNSSRGQGRRGNPLENAVYLGTRFGQCVPEMFSPAYGRFQEFLAGAGYNIYPSQGYDEYPRFQGGHSVASHFARMSQEGKRCLAIQIEVPRALRLSNRVRSEFTGVLKNALIDLSSEMIET
jgi:N-formylglutamate amidohydrolase